MINLVNTKKTMFYTATNNWIYILENNYLLIKNELETYLIQQGKHNLSKYYSYSSNQNGWLTIPLIFFTIKNPATINLFPETIAILKKVPELITAEFSILEAHTSINAHEGYSKQVMRTHLGLKIPEGDLALKSVDEIKKWTEGKTLSFNDGELHEAWNNSEKERWVLMIDTPVPNSKYTAFDISKYKLENLTDKTLLSLGRKEEWLTELLKNKRC